MRIAPQGVDGVRLYRRLLRQVWPYKGVFGLALLGMLLVAGGDAGFATMLKPIMDRGFVERDAAFIVWVPVLLVLLALLRAVGGFVDGYCMNWVARRVVQDLRQQMFEKLLRAPASYFDQQASGALVARLTYDVEQVAQASSSAFRVLFRDTLKAVFLLTWMFYLSWQLSLVFAIIFPLAFVVLKLSSRRFRAIGTRVQTSVGELTQVAKEALHGYRLVKIFDAYAQEAQGFYRANNRNRQQLMKRAAILAASVPLMVLLSGGGVAGVIWLALLQEISPGVFSSYLLSLTMLTRPLQNLTKVNESIQTGIAGAESIFRTLDIAAEVDAGQLRLDKVDGHVEFKDVAFEYAPRRRVLEHISFAVPAGASVALVGVSGSGKSTIAKLLLRLYEPTAGSIEIDGQALRDIKLAAWRRHTAMVTQEVMLFDQSVRDNIVYGDAQPDEARLRAAARAAYVTEFVDKLPQGFDTMVGEHGVRLSGGQCQRIAIARALYKDAPILILDEATSALDAQSEQHIQAALGQLLQNRTTLVIAHRLSTIERADLILVLQHGRIVERGRHRELLGKNGVYASLYRDQAAGSPEGRAAGG